CSGTSNGMMEAEKGSLVIGMGPSHRGWNGTTPLRAEPRGWNADIDHAWGYLTGCRLAYTRIMSFLCIATGNVVQCHMPGGAGSAAPPGGIAEADPTLDAAWRRIRPSDLGLGGLHRAALNHLAHLACLLGQRAHLCLHIFAVQPHRLGQILGVQQLLC